MNEYKEVRFSDLVGQTINRIEVDYNTDEVKFYTSTMEYRMFHDRD